MVYIIAISDVFFKINWAYQKYLCLSINYKENLDY